jgi:peptidyl-prolyl cis-trans isomerase SurA
MKFFCTLLFCSFLISPSAMFAQETNTPKPSETVLSVGSEEVSLADFQHIFMKNNRDSVISIASLDEYLELFIRFKLKVQAAEELGLDTVATFQRELAGYRSQLSRPYMTNNDLLQDLVYEAWERKQKEVRARHILISCGAEATPEDTLKAWNRANDLRNRIASGEDFEAVAQSKSGSDDPSARENGGDLGWFSAFQMVYPFEEAAYTTETGNLSTIVRTRYGYHFLEVTGKREARGEIRAAHIMVRLKKDADAAESTKTESKINQIYTLLNEGMSWQELALKMSEDASTSSKGGELPWFGTGKMVESFEDAAFNLSADGQISEPFKTSYGWHIVKRLEYRAPASFEASKREIEKKVSRDSRSELTRASFIENLKVEYDFEVTKSPLARLYRLISQKDSVFYPNHPIQGMRSSDLAKTILTIADEKSSLGDFIDHLNRAKIRNPTLDKRSIVLDQLKAWSEGLLLTYEDVRLEEKYDAFRLLMEEYHDGILLFELTDEKVWSRAVKDTVGLEAYHLNHTEDFMWNTRVEVRAFILANGKLAKKVRKAITKGKELEPIANDANESNALAYRLEEGLFSEGENAWADRVIADYAAGVLTTDSEGPLFVEYTAGGKEVILVEVQEIRNPEPKTLTESRGQVIAAYQDQLETDWIQELRSQKTIDVNRTLLHSLAD